MMWWGQSYANETIDGGRIKDGKGGLSYLFLLCTFYKHHAFSTFTTLHYVVYVCGYDYDYFFGCDYDCGFTVSIVVVVVVAVAVSQVDGRMRGWRQGTTTPGARWPAASSAP